MKRAHLLGILATLSATGCNFDVCVDLSQASFGGAAQPIIGGTIDDANPSTVALLVTLADGTHAFCSGTVIATSGDTGWVLTAAHCAAGTVDRIVEASDWRACTADSGFGECRASYTPVSWVQDPSYDDATHVHDFALVQFSGATGSTAVTPVVSTADGLAAGASLELSGYGRDYAGADDPTKFQTAKHHVTVSISSLTDAKLVIDGSTGKTACFGDSGGPAYATVGGSRRVVGVASAADATCEHVAIYGRVSDVYEDFIAPTIGAGASAPSCNVCLASSLLSTPTCQTLAFTCHTDAECAGLLSCVLDCATPDAACYAACATAHPAGMGAFNELATCVACGSCSDACGVEACGGEPGSTTSSTGATGGDGEATSTSSGGDDPSIATGAGGASNEAGAGGDGGAGGGGEAATSGGTSSPGQVCVPANISCAMSAPDGSTSGGMGAAVAALAIAALKRRRRA